jgi:hypothetical protein
MKRFVLTAFLILATTATSNAEILPHPHGCPARLYCGCGVSVRVFKRSIRSLWPARAWLKFRRAYAAPGRVAVWRHHVAYIEAVDGRNALLYDPNSGRHLTRRHWRSLAGATIVDPLSSAVMQ